jgi:hypothetical protein
MLLDFEIQRSTRRCAATDRELLPGESCYSVIQFEGADVVRRDYASEAWTGPPEEAFGWWRTRVPEPAAKKIKLAPNDVLLELFDQLADRPGSEDMRYVLALLLVRRRVFRSESADTALLEPSKPADVESLVVYCPKRDATHEIAVVMPSDERIDEIQQQLSELLVAGGEDDQDKEIGRQGDKEAA